MKHPDYIFECHKCGHEVYVGKGKVVQMLKHECPECGEEAYRNWIIVGEGNFNKK